MVRQLCCIVLCCVCVSTRADDLSDRIATWLRSHGFNPVLSSGDMAAGRLRDVYIVATDDFVIVRESTFESKPSWTSRLVDAMQFAVVDGGIMLETKRRGSRHVATIWPASRDKQVRAFAELQKAGDEIYDSKQFEKARSLINEHLQRQQ